MTAMRAAVQRGGGRPIRAVRFALALAVALAGGAGPASATGPVFDMHVHLRDGEASLRSYRDAARAAGVEVTGLAAMRFGGPHQAREGDPAAIRADNDAIIALAAAHDDVVAVAVVHPHDGEPALQELERVAGLGVAVLKLHPHTQGFDAADPRVATVVRRAGELGMVVVIDNANILPGDSETLFNLAIRAPGTRFVFAHAGAMNFRFWNVLALARTAEAGFGDNIHFDISATVVLVADSPLEEEFVWMLRNVGIDRVMFGSDFPQFEVARANDALQRLDLTDAEKARIREGNARRLFAR